jgi:hypothetical protein
MERAMGIKVSRELYAHLENRLKNKTHYYDADGNWRWWDMTKEEVDAVIDEADDWNASQVDIS